MTPLQQHLQKRPEMPRGLRSDHPQFIAWQRAFQAWVTEKHSLEIEERVAGIDVGTVNLNRPSCSTKADYLWRDLRGRRTA